MEEKYRLEPISVKKGMTYGFAIPVVSASALVLSKVFYPELSELSDYLRIHLKEISELTYSNLAVAGTFAAVAGSISGGICGILDTYVVTPLLNKASDMICKSASSSLEDKL